MGKKGKKKGASSASTKAEKEQKRAARVSLIDKHGRMPRDDGIKFYALLDLLAHIVIDDVERERRWSESTYIPFHWPERDGLQKMPDSARSIVLTHIWKNINRISDEIDNGDHDGLFLRKVGRRIQDADKDEIRSWRNHIEDDFIVINHVPHVGSIFVQVGRVVQFEQKIAGSVKDETDIHEPRVFCVQGLATPMQELLQGSHTMLMEAYPSLEKYGLPISFCHATLLPYSKGVTYAVTLEQTNRSYYETPQQYAEAVKIATDCYKKAILKDQTTTIQCTLYDTITPAIARRAWEKGTNKISHEYEKWLREEALGGDEREKDPEMTLLRVSGIIWMPFKNSANFTDPRSMDAIQEIMTSKRPLKNVREGFKHRITWEVWCNDHEPCPFHRQLGGGDVDTPSFAECCKKDHLKRVEKARKRDEKLICEYWYNPVEEEEAEAIAQDVVARQNILNTLRIGSHDVSDLRLRVPLSYVDKVKWRMDNAQIYVPIIDSEVELKWIYVGWIPVGVQDAGLLSYGDVTLNTETGIFAATAMTADRCSALITRMKYICSYGEEIGEGIPVEDISLVGTRMGKSKPDKAAMSRNIDQLQEDFDIKASMEIDKVSHTYRTCAYCGKIETGQDDFKLLQCACKKYHYCSKEHQKLNWKDHKAICKKIRGEGK
mmetsp:Transcript_19665/g.32244  ORF Transcript_19665/g.32244 Transcript_19665/m.32244 type:complete len:661 (+) Transcript_19665:95-2077(+)